MKQIRLKFLLGAGVIVFFGLPLLQMFMSRDAYLVSTIPALWLTVAGALIVGFICVWFLRDQARPLENPLKRALGSFFGGAYVGGLLVSLTLNALVHFTAGELHTGWVSYKETSGWKNCLFGIAFEDPILGKHIVVCGPRWKFPDSPAGMLQVTEASGQYGVVLQQVTADSEPSQ